MNPYALRLKEYSDFAFLHSDTQDIPSKKWSEFFQKRLGEKYAQKLILEIGCSNAHYLADVAQSRPEFGFVGIDWKFKAIYHGANYVQRKAVQNVALVRGIARGLPDLFSKNDLDEIWAFFSDPWPKRAQQKHRLLQRTNLKIFHELLKPRGMMHIKTDHPEYFHFVAKEFRSMDAAFELVFSTENFWQDFEARKIAGDLFFTQRKTLFENIFLKKGLPIYYMAVKKK